MTIYWIASGLNDNISVMAYTDETIRDRMYAELAEKIGAKYLSRGKTFAIKPWPVAV